METRSDLRYSREHEWVKLEADEATIGITDYAQSSLGTVVFVELPEVDREVSTGDVLGVVESVKAASEIFAPVTGRIARVNEILEDFPENINEQPYAEWIVVIEGVDKKEWDELMDETAYKEFCAQEEG